MIEQIFSCTVSMREKNTETINQPKANNFLGVLMILLNKPTTQIFKFAIC